MSIDIPDHSGWRARRDRERARKAMWEAGRERRSAISLLISQADERRNRENFLSVAERKRDEVRAEISRVTAQLQALTDEDLANAEQAVEAARTRLDDLVDDVERAKSILEAEATIEATDR